MKRILALLMVLVMVFALCACEESVPSETSTPEKETSSMLEFPVSATPAVEYDPFDFGDINYTLEIPVYELVKMSVLSSTYEYSDFVYNEKGLLIEKKESGSSNGIITYEYDENDRLLSERDTNNYGYSQVNYFYNDDGLVERELYSSDSTSIDENIGSDISYVLDDNGHVIKKTKISDLWPNEPSVFEYEYDENGIQIQETETHYEGSKIDSQYILTKMYDSSGRLIRELVYDVNDQEYWDYKYEYAPVSSRAVSTETDTTLQTTDKWISFVEEIELPMPDSCITDIHYETKEDNGSAIIYTFILPQNQEDANNTYHKYQLILANVCGFSLENKDDMMYISKDGELCSLMMAGNDDEYGYFLQISFPSNGKATSSQTASVNSTSVFSNKYGTATTKCAISGCDNYIASSGDSNCCASHSNRCLNCNCYIDGDAMYCMSCLTASSTKSSSNTTKPSSSSNSNKSSSGCKYEYSNGSVCGAKCSSGRTLCDKHFNELNAIYQSLIG